MFEVWVGYFYAVFSRQLNMGVQSSHKSSGQRRFGNHQENSRNQRSKRSCNTRARVLKNEPCVTSQAVQNMFQEDLLSNLHIQSLCLQLYGEECACYAPLTSPRSITHIGLLSKKCISHRKANTERNKQAQFCITSKSRELCVYTVQSIRERSTSNLSRGQWQDRLLGEATLEIVLFVRGERCSTNKLCRSLMHSRNGFPSGVSHEQSQLVPYIRI